MSDFGDMIQGLSRGTSGLSESLTNISNRKQAKAKAEQEKTMKGFRIAMELMGSPANVAQKQGVKMFQALSEKNKDMFGGVAPDMAGIFDNYRDTDTFKDWQKDLKEVLKLKDTAPRKEIDSLMNDLLLEAMDWEQGSIPEVTMMEKMKGENQEAMKKNQADLRSGKIQRIPPNPMGAKGMPRPPKSESLEGRGQYQLTPETPPKPTKESTDPLLRLIDAKNSGKYTNPADIQKIDKLITDKLEKNKDDFSIDKALFGMGYISRGGEIFNIQEVDGKKTLVPMMDSKEITHVYKTPQPDGTIKLQGFDDELNLIEEKVIGANPERLTEKEQDTQNRKAYLPELNKLAAKDPNATYDDGWKMNDDGTPSLDYNGSPTMLPDFTEKLGKRGIFQKNGIFAAGEHWDDAQEIMELLSDPEVAKNLYAAHDKGFGSRLYGMARNEINQWFAKKGLSVDDKTTEAVIRMGRMASVDRNKLLGAAVTNTELGSVQEWMIDPGDNFATIMAKIKVASAEGEEIFMRFLDTYKDIANMSPFYRAFGIKRFNKKTDDLSQMSDEQILQGLGQ